MWNKLDKNAVSASASLIMKLVQGMVSGQVMEGALIEHRSRYETYDWPVPSLPSLAICPKSAVQRSLMMSEMWERPVLSLIVELRTLSCHLMPSMRCWHRIWNAWSLEFTVAAAAGIDWEDGPRLRSIVEKGISQSVGPRKHQNLARVRDRSISVTSRQAALTAGSARHRVHVTELSPVPVDDGEIKLFQDLAPPRLLPYRLRGPEKPLQGRLVSAQC